MAAIAISYGFLLLTIVSTPSALALWISGDQEQAFIATLISGLGAFLIAMIVWSYGDNPSPPTMQTRLSQVRETLQRTGSLLHGLEKELDARFKFLQERQQQLEEYEALADVSSEARDALEGVIAEQLKKEGRRSLRRDVMLVVAGIGTGLLVNWLYDLLAK